MADKKYEFIENDIIKYETGSLCRIRALKDFGDVKAGDLGGYIEKEKNLSHEGNCWVYEQAEVFHNATILDNAKIKDNARIFDNAEVGGNAEISDNADILDSAMISGNVKVYGNAEVGGNVKAYGEAQIYDNAKVYGNSEVYGSAKVYDYAQVSGNAKIYGEAKVYDNVKIYDYAQVYGNAEVCKKTKMYGFTEVGDNTKMVGTFSFVKKENSEKENKFQKFEEHCSEIVDKLKLQDELPNFQVISQKGVLYEKNNEDNNITEIKNFIENLKGIEFWDNMSLKDIRDWKELKNDEFVSVIYETKDKDGNLQLEEFTDYNDYAKDTVKSALEKEFKNNPDTIENLKKDILDKVPSKEVIKEKVEIVKDIEKEEKVTSKTFGYRSDF